MRSEGYGLAGRLAALSLDSKLTSLLLLGALLLGGLAILKTPREEEPQIVVPFADVIVGLPGAAPGEVEDRVTRPIEQLAAELPGVEYVYATSFSDMSMVTVRFKVGDDQERSLVKLYDVLARNMDAFPPGATPPLVKARLIDDVPILGLTLWQENGDTSLLRDLAAALDEEIHSIPEVSKTEILGGNRRTLEVRLDPRAMATLGIDASRVVNTLQAANVAAPGGTLVADGRAISVRTSALLETPDDVASLVVGVVDGRPVRLGSVADIVPSAEQDQYVSILGGVSRPALRDPKAAEPLPGRVAPAVTLSVAKRKGSDATRVAEAVLSRVERVRGRLLPADVHLTVTRDYGETANEKASDLLKHLGIAILLVTLLTGIVLGARGSAVVFVSVPVTFALTLFTYYLFGYTLNRVTLFALIFITGIVVDDSIIVVENITRHLSMRPSTRMRPAILAAVSEVGNPTVLATLTVIASVFPMAFVGGLMGPYMRPMPIGASLAMTFSLLVALTIAPWLSKRLFRARPESESANPRIRRLYDRVLGPLLDHPRRGWTVLGVIAGLTLASFALLPLRVVTVKMLPFDNKSEMQVLVDLPDGTPLETTAGAAREVADALASVPEVKGIQIYTGLAGPITFNGLVRHYDYRRGPQFADLQVNLAAKSERKRKSHALAAVLRERALPAAARYGARLKVVELPPGPPVLSTLVAEVYGPDASSRLALAGRVKQIMQSTPGVVDVDWMVEDPQPEWKLHIDQTEAALAGVAPASLSGTIALALSGVPAGTLHPRDTFEPVPLVVRWPREDRNDLFTVTDLRIPTMSGGWVPAAAILRPEAGTIQTSLYRKNGRPVVYVTGELSGRQESPVYAILDMKRRVDALRGEQGEPVAQLFAAQPASEGSYAVRWDGEWDITRHVFRDLGMAFGVVLILIYMLIAGWFKDLRTPLVMMVSIPLSLVGVILGHWVFRGFFTATSMIGFIALAGVMVRNGVLLLDFVALARERGLPLREALLESGAVRLRPIALTAGTVIVGALVILFDPIFQGLAISLIGGSVTATVLTLVVVPVVYNLMERNRAPRSVEEGA
jgi:multidrug efflux pump subunit AcrB